MTMGEVTEFIERFAALSRAPVRTGTTVTSVRRTDDGYHVTTSARRDRAAGPWSSRAAPATSRRCRAFADAVPASVEQLTPFDYRDPAKLPDGGVLVVGASATGVQLAAELQRSGRPVTLSVGEHVRLPRTYRGRDVLWWMDASGVWDQRYDEVEDLTRARRLPSPQLVGTPERTTLDLNALTSIGVELVGRWAAVRDGRALFSGGLRNVFSLADLKMRRLLDTFDEWARTNGRDAEVGPPERFAPTRVPASTRLQLDLGSGEIRAIVWATGFRPDYGWLDVPVARREGPAAPRGRRGRQPGTVRARAARAAAAQVHVHLRHRGRRACGDRSPRPVPGRAQVTWPGWPRLTGDTTTVRVRRKVVDARYLEPSIPATHVPSFDAEPGVRLIPVNDLVRLDIPASGFTVIGAGKTAIDACLWLLESGVPPEAICWIRPRDAWLLDRAFQQPLDLVPRLMEGVSLYLEAAAQADGISDLFRRLEACGQLIRLDRDVEPAMYRCATVSEAELVRLRTIQKPS